MNFLTALFAAIIGFVRRNPITCLVVLVLAVAAPAVLKGIAIFILYFILGMILLGVLLMLLLRWRIYKLRQQSGSFSADGDPNQGNPFARRGGEPAHEGDVKVFRTQESPEKRVSKSVGDYVEFEETHEDK